MTILDFKLWMEMTVDQLLLQWRIRRRGFGIENPISQIQKSRHAATVAGLLIFTPSKSSFSGSGASASTQVSLLPPPCDELTTSDPLFSATRVRPPGKTKIS